VFLIGLFFILLGLALSVLPGPLTIPPVLLGLVIWAAEFAWAERLVDRAKRQAQEAWEAARAHPWRAGLVTGGGVVLLVVGLVLASRYDLLDRATSWVT
jgi:drug/metabolite transporter (DMT)-like permease